jgi:hypothetical protein
MADSSDKPISWLDLGCGSAQVANLVRPEIVRCQKYSSLGVDSNNSDLEWGRAQAGGLFSRNFIKHNALQSEITISDFNLITAFEFLEHLIDPLSFLIDLGVTEGSYFIAGTPLNEPINITPWSNVHVWSFTKDDLCKIFETAGFEVLGSNESRFSTRCGGLDYLTVIAKKHGA